MKKLRHIIAVDLQEHGSPLKSYRTKQFEGKKWIEIVPERFYSLFEFDSKVDGAKITPKVLFNRNEAQFSFKQNVISYSNFPSTYEFLILPFLSESAFKDIIIQRTKIFRKVKNHILTLSENYKVLSANEKSCLLLLQLWKEHNTEMLPFMFLSLATDEIVLQSYQDTMYSERREIATTTFKKIFSSNFAKLTIGSESCLPIMRSFVLPPLYGFPKVSFPEDNEIELMNIIESFYVQLKKDNNNVFEKYLSTHELLSKLHYQLTEENYFVWQTYAIIINHILYKLQTLLNVKEDLTNYTISELETLIISKKV